MGVALVTRREGVERVLVTRREGMERVLEIGHG